jgi:GNAT superfamily N-acetyltransferase
VSGIGIKPTVVSPSAETTVSISARLCAGASRTPELAICAHWRANAFSVLKASFEEELRSLELFASDQSHGVALAAKADAEPIGTCLLVESEIEPNRDVSSWLAGLFLVPEHRRRGAGAELVRAIEDQAATASCPCRSFCRAGRFQRHTNTGVFVFVSTLFVTLPRTIADSPLRPCDAITIRSQPLSVAVAMMA